MRNRFSLLLFKLALVVISSVFTLTLFAQTFDDPEAETDGGLESEVAASTDVTDAQLDESLEEYLEENPSIEGVSEDQLSEESGFDTFIPSEDISEDFSVPFPVDI